MYNILYILLPQRKAFVILIDTAYLIEVDYLSTFTTVIEYAQQPKSESHKNQQWDASEMSPAPTKLDTLLDEFSDIFIEPTQPQARLINTT